MGIRARKGGLTLQTAGGHTVAAGHVVIAAGYEVARWLGIERGHLHSTWAVASAPIDDLAWWPHKSLVWETRRPYLDMRTTADGRLLLGGEDEPGAERHKDRALFNRKVRRILRRFSAWFPSRTIEIEFAWAGVFGSTPDGLPYIGTIPRHPRLIFALGYGGNGITFGMVAARLIRDWALGTPGVDGKLFTMRRRPRPVAPKGILTGVRGTNTPAITTVREHEPRRVF
jgi:glycine/D-amino acid oxidase-like deaminating enzyme